MLPESYVSNRKLLKRKRGVDAPRVFFMSLSKSKIIDQCLIVLAHQK
jgi:hypothetical protein